MSAGPIDLFVVGAMKAATTAMCDWLDAQPGLAVSVPKEPSIFTSESSVAQWVPRIDELYADAADGDLRIDGSTDYAKFPAIDGVPERLSLVCPQAKVVYMMRHPVERLLSQYRFEWYLGNRKRSLEHELQVNPQLLDNSRYAAQLARWLRSVGRDQVLLVFAEAFSQQPEVEVARVLEFLGRGSTGVVVPGRVRSNESSHLVRRTWVRRVFRRSSLGRTLRPLVPSPVVAAYKRRLHQASRPDLSDELRRDLERALDDDLRGLTELTGGPAISCQSWHTVATTWTPTLLPA